MVDRADPGFFGPAWRFGDFCQQLNPGSVYLQSVLKYLGAEWDIKELPERVIMTHSNPDFATGWPLLEIADAVRQLGQPNRAQTACP
jgi:hypothetical protein